MATIRYTINNGTRPFTATLYRVTQTNPYLVVASNIHNHTSTSATYEFTNLVAGRTYYLKIFDTNGCKFTSDGIFIEGAAREPSPTGGGSNDLQAEF